MSIAAIWTISKRELKSYFVSPVAYVVLGIFALISGIHFVLTMNAFDQELQRAQVQQQLMGDPTALQYLNLNEMLIMNVIQFGFMILLFALPALTMRLLSEERARGTYELLMTSPLGTLDIVLGKFLAGVFFFILMIATHALLVGVMFIYGNPEPGPVLSGYLGFFLGGSALVALGLFASSLTENQIIAYFISLLVGLGFLMVGWGANVTTGNLSLLLEKSSIMNHFANFNKGLIATSSIVFFLTLWILFLSLSKVSLESLTRR